MPLLGWGSGIHFSDGTRTLSLTNMASEDRVLKILLQIQSDITGLKDGGRRPDGTELAAIGTF